MALAATVAELQRLLDTVAFTRRFGFTVASLGDGTCTLEVPFHEEFERPGGIVSGQVFMAAADVASWLAIMTTLGAADESVTLDLKTAFLSAVRREGFRCEARVLKLGRRVIYLVATCATASGEIVAHHTVTYARPSAPRSGPAARRQRTRDGAVSP